MNTTHQRGRGGEPNANKYFMIGVLVFLFYQMYFLVQVHKTLTAHQQQSDLSVPQSSQLHAVEEPKRAVQQQQQPAVQQVSANRHQKHSDAIKPPVPNYPPPQKQKLLPKRVITIFGAESSGTTFLSTALGVATGAFAEGGRWQPVPLSDRWKWEKDVERRVMSDDGEWEIQHVSQPWGWNCNTHNTVDVVEALIPEECSRLEYYPQYTLRQGDGLLFKNKGKPPNNPPPVNPEFTPEEKRIREMCRNEVHAISKDNWSCGAKCGSSPAYEGFALYPKRFSVNITSHIEWYLSRGVDITVILSVRDRTIHMKGKTTHCKNKDLRDKEEEVAMLLMKEALEQYGKRGADEGEKERAIVISYEGLMGVQEAYLFELYAQLGIDSTYAPLFKDGNAKYVTKQNNLQIGAGINGIDGQTYQTTNVKEEASPRRLISVVGLQGSGVAFFSNVLSTATGALSSNGGKFDELEVQHFTLPTGCTGTGGNELNGLQVVDAYAPSEREELMRKKGRFIVNITSHIEWYLTHNVDITVVVMMRDRSISSASKSKHCPSSANTQNEDEMALTFIRKSIQRYGMRSTSKTGDKVRVIPVSYEALMEFKASYLFDLYHQLGVDSTYVPVFRDANGKYITDARKEDVTRKTVNGRAVRRPKGAAS